MRTITYSLAWKEWHEHKWKLAALVTVFAAVMSLMLPITREHNMSPDLFDVMRGMLMLCVLPLSIFLGMRTAAEERSRGTLPFLQALPAPMWRVGLHKLVFGLATLWLAVSLAILFIFALSLTLNFLGTDIGSALVESARNVPRLGSGRWFLGMIALPCIAGGSLFIWTTALGVNQTDEVRAGAIGLAVMACIWGSLMYFWGAAFPSADSPQAHWLLQYGFALAPAGLATLLDSPYALWNVPQLTVAFVGHVALVGLYVYRFGRFSNLGVRSPQVAAAERSRDAWLAPPCRTPLTAIAWKQARESGPVALVGLTCALTIALVVAWVHQLSGTEFIVIALGACAYMGGFAALVIGIGVFLNDLRPDINTFWRSRPISPNLWFWTKFATGLTIILATYVLPMWVIAMLVASPEGQLDLTEAQSLQIYALAGFSAIFASAVATTCLVRQPIYAAVLSITLLYVVSVPWLLIWDEPLTDSQVALIFSSSAVVATLLAWLAVRHDWGRKG